MVLPVAAVAEKDGTFVNWEGRPGTFGPALQVPGIESDLHVLRRIADEMDVHLGLPDAAAARAELGALGAGAGSADQAETAYGAPIAPVPETAVPRPGPGQAVLATWSQLLDAGRMQDGEPFLAGTARPVLARMSAATAAQAGVADGGKVTVATDRGSLTLPVEVTEMADQVVWLPAHSMGPRCGASSGPATAAW